MMWADRIVIGVCVLVVLGGLIACALDTTAADRKQRQDQNAANVAACNQPWPEDDLFRKYSKMGCPPEAPTPIPDAPIAEYVMRLIGLVALPIWAVLRIVDFMFGGPARRRTKKA
jgi:hypothetical protein